jgi:putative FmdB family regulatory protein
MPIYEYECTSCNNTLEVIQRISEQPLCSCPECSGSLKKLVSVSSFQLKGGGWYADGYSSSSPDDTKSASKKNGNGAKNGQEKSTKSPANTAKKADSANTSSSKKSSAAAA